MRHPDHAPKYPDGLQPPESGIFSSLGPFGSRFDGASEGQTFYANYDQMGPGQQGAQGPLTAFTLEY